MSALKDQLAGLIHAKREEVISLIRDHGDHVISEVTVAQAYGGMRGVKCMVTETSALDPDTGIRFRGYSIPELQQQLPRGPGGQQPLPEGLFWLLVTGSIPTVEQTMELTTLWRANEQLPRHVSQVLDALPETTHPMTQFSVGIMAMQTDSIFVRRYREGMRRRQYWEAVLDDAMILLARLPLVAAYIYRRTYHGGEHLPPAPPELDWAANLAHMMLGSDEPGFLSFMRMYLTILADHEGGNVSAHTTHLVGSALSDPYLCLAAGMNGLAGPLHGLAAQEVMRWILEMKRDLGGGVPSHHAIRQHVWDTLEAGRVIPGFGHGVLRTTDPRYIAQRDFARAYLPDDENFKIISDLFSIVPEVLIEQGKAKNPWPNVDAHTGCMWMHYGVEQYDFYTVLFGVSRALGVMASLIWDRALALPLERPKSVTTEWMRAQLAKA